MAEITAALVKELRDQTGAGMMDCKRALGDTNGDVEAAVDWLRKKGLAAAAKKAGRVAAEGLIGIATGPKAGAVVEVNSETDFVARNELFQDFVRKVAQLAVAADRDIEALKAASFAGNGKTVEGELTDLIARIGENMVLRRVARLGIGQGYVASYVHNSVSPGLGKIGVLVALESAAGEDVLAPLGRQLAMHVAAANPLYLDQTSVPASALDRERAVLRDQAGSTGKSADIVEKMVEGRLRKFYEETVLLDQVYVIDGESRISKVVEAAAKSAGTLVKIAAFVRFVLGEGIDRPTIDLAAEVAAQLAH
ncbi:MAG TPA: translation elongation factor Ts [Stellaceae bacterium]|jgi:elongation factor Ts|nr:translation elongation factor Ts [Stellaceae bacterium]